MKRISIFIGICILLAAASGCGNLLDRTAVPPTLAQKLRGIWMVGGLQLAGIANTVSGVDLYDPDTNSWYASVTNLSTAVSFAGAASYQSKIFVFGGFNSAGAAVNLTQIYDIASNTWTTGTPIPAVRANISAVEKYGRIYILGGSAADATAAWTNTTTNYEYSISGNSWTTKTAIAAARSDMAAVSFNDVIYHMGGRQNATTPPQTAHDGFLVTPGGLTGGAEPVLNPARSGMTVGVYAPSTGPAFIVMVGGFTAFTGTSQNFAFSAGMTGVTPVVAGSSFQYLNYPFTAWQAVANPYPGAMLFLSGAIKANKIYCFGGTISNTANPMNNAYSYNLDNLAGSWAQCANMPTARFGHTAVTISQ